MMNTVGKMSSDKQGHKPYIWKKEWVRPYESLFGVMLNFCRVNTLDGTKAEKLLKKTYQNLTVTMKYRHIETVIHPTYLELLLPHWYISQMNYLYSVQNGYQLIDPRLYYCPECIKNGYHSYFHQLVNAKKCVIHGTELKCDKSSGYIKDDIAIIEYNTDSLAIKNARNLVHPCLRKNGDIIYPTNWFKGKYNKLIHYVSMGEDTYEYIKHELHCPYKFVVEKKYDWHKVVRHCCKSYDDLFEALSNNEDLPEAIRLFDRYELQNHYSDELQPTKSAISKHNIIEYYLYCKCMNFTREERRLDFNERNVELDDVIYEEDDPKLKFSFIWALKDSNSSDVILSTHWLFFVGNYSNYCVRNIFNGIRLEDVKVSDLDDNYFGINNLLASIYIIDDMFEQLWKQYIYLSKHPGGVKVGDGWKELIIPEYFIAKSRTDDGFEIFRLDPVFPGYRWNY